MVRVGNTVRPYGHSNPMKVADPKDREGGYRNPFEPSPMRQFSQVEREKRRKARKAAKKARRK